MRLVYLISALSIRAFDVGPSRAKTDNPVALRRRVGTAPRPGSEYTVLSLDVLWVVFTGLPL